jgi:hypothetical protein
MGGCFSQNSEVIAPEKANGGRLEPSSSVVEHKSETAGFSPIRDPKALMSRSQSEASGSGDQFTVRGTNPRRIQYSKTDKETSEHGQADVKALLYSTVSYACIKGMKPGSPNQDDFCICFNEGVLICGVFDGHGKV